ncbi:N-alpha-acetyltransferase, non-catalitic subunit [Polyrhizophydium stewartii]|uniref:N-alpha-acetyltransferase, non-catalitic subunit n=1 Tax=Polyrhizophydium stewartii TaxID=2732419 RepID=A0ABR4NIP4_9FUNG
MTASCDRAPELKLGIAAAFDGLINRLKYSQYPAIQAAPLTTLDGLKAWMALLGHIGEILAWRTNEDELTIMETASNFAAANPVMCSLSRAFMHYALFADGKLLGKRPAVVAVRSAMMQTLLPPFDEASSARMADIMDLLCTRCEEAFSYNFKLFCFNRARQRRNLFKAIEAWDAVQQECEALDVEITAIHEGHDDAEQQQYYFSSWVYTQKLRAMTECYALGFELELYYVNEYPMIFWYLQYLHDTRAGYLERMLKLRAAGAESKRDLLSSFARDNETIEQFLTMEAYRDHAKTKMCLGLLEVTRVLRSLGLLDVVEPDMNTEELNYVNRFRVMTHLSSPLVLQTESYMEFMHKAGRKGIDPHIKVATMEFQTAKAYLEQIATTKRTDAHSLALKAEGQALLKVCIGNLIGLRMFPWKCMAELPADAKTPMANQRRVLFDFKYHSAFPFLVREP